MPDVVCLDLQTAQDTIQAEGKWLSRSNDATGQGRHQILDRDWVVVSQSPAAGEIIKDTPVLQVVKQGEPSDC